MRTLIATVLLFGLGTGLAWAEGGGDSNLAVHRSMLQVQRGSYGAQMEQSGREAAWLR